MKTILRALLACCLLAIPAAAQMPQQSASKIELSAWLRNAYGNTRNNLIKSAENVPVELYGIRPGPQEEVRTYGQIVGHLANFNYLWCSQAKGEKNPKGDTNFEKLTQKSDLIAALHDAF